MRRVAEDERIYEAMFLIRNKPAKDDIDGIMKEINSYLEEIDAKVINCGKWDERKLAYDISGERRGTYILCHFEAKPDRIVRLERRCQISETILRALVVRDTDGTELPVTGGGVARAAPAPGAATSADVPAKPATPEAAPAKEAAAAPEADAGKADEAGVEDAPDKPEGPGAE